MSEGSIFLSNHFKSICKLLKIRYKQRLFILNRMVVWKGVIGYYQNICGSMFAKIRLIGLSGVPYVVYVYNTTVHTTTAYAPFELVYGCRLEIPSALRVTPTVKYNYENFLTALRGRLLSANEFARQNLISSKKVRNIMIRILKHLKLRRGRK